MGVCNCSMFCCTLVYVHSSIAIILMGKRELIALLNLSSWCLVMVEWLFLAVSWGCLQFVIVVFSWSYSLTIFYWRSCWNRDAIMAITTLYMVCQTIKRLTPKHIGEEKAGWFTLIAWMMYYDCQYYVVSVFIAVPLFGLKCVIVVFPDHTQILLLLLVKLYTRQTDWKTWCSCSMQKVTLLE